MGEQDVADQRGAFACRGPRHPRGGGALFFCTGAGCAGQTNGDIGEHEWPCGFKCGYVILLSLMVFYRFLVMCLYFGMISRDLTL